jgi:hypothetical protein
MNTLYLLLNKNDEIKSCKRCIYGLVKLTGIPLPDELNTILSFAILSEDCLMFIFFPAASLLIDFNLRHGKTANGINISSKYTMLY